MKKVLIANRGEIAVRIIRACHDLGLQTVAVYSRADAEALHVLHADEAICIGEAPAAESYLKVSNILSAAEITGADAIHPGFGFLSENANFASICESCGVTFVGPSSKAISLLGDKAQAKAIAKSVGCPVIPGSEGVLEDVEAARACARDLGYPVLIKAVAGGGGRGIRFVHSENELENAFDGARTEALAGFGNGDVYMEKLIVDPRHVEVQILADTHGNTVYLGERECSIQRRRQKLIEEAPSIAVSPELRKKMGEAAVSLAQAAGYSSAGTVEFLLDDEGHFYFMEMNTRIQVEHTVTEQVTGIDLVCQQLYVARGETLRFTQEEITIKGHAIQWRINAEDPSQNFAPFPGKVEYYLPPGGPNIRIDSALYAGYRIPPYYDAMIAKLITFGNNREEALDVARRALREFHVGGIRTTIPFHQHMLSDKRFCEGDVHINYVDQLLEKGMKIHIPEEHFV